MDVTATRGNSMTLKLLPSSPMLGFCPLQFLPSATHAISLTHGRMKTNILGHQFMKTHTHTHKNGKINCKLDCCLGRTLLKGQRVVEHTYSGFLEGQAFSLTSVKKDPKASPCATEKFGNSFQESYNDVFRSRRMK